MLCIIACHRPGPSKTHLFFYFYFLFFFFASLTFSLTPLFQPIASHSIHPSISASSHSAIERGFGFSFPLFFSFIFFFHSFSFSFCAESLVGSPLSLPPQFLHPTTDCSWTSRRSHSYHPSIRFQRSRAEFQVEIQCWCSSSTLPCLHSPQLSFGSLCSKAIVRQDPDCIYRH